MDDLVVGLSAFAVRANGTDRTILRSRNSSRSLRGSRNSGRRRNRMNGVLGLGLNTKGERDDLGNVSVGTINLDGDTKRLSQETHGFETFLVVGATTTNVDADIVGDEGSLVLLQGTDDTLEGSGNVGEVGDTTTNDEDLAFRVGISTGNEVDCRQAMSAHVRYRMCLTLTDSLGVLVGLSLSGSTRVFTVVSKLMSESMSSDGIRVDDGSTTTSNHGPDTTLGVKDSELQRSTSRTIKFLDVRLLLGQVTTERSWPDLYSKP